MAFFNQGRRDPYAAGISWLGSVWIFSSINAVLFFFSSTYFVVGLVMSQLLLALPVFSTSIAIVLIVVLLGVLFGCWAMARRGKEIGLLVASLIYMADLVALIAVGFWSGSLADMVIDFGFHIVALVMMIRGFVHGVRAKTQAQSGWVVQGNDEDREEEQDRIAGM